MVDEFNNSVGDDEEQGSGGRGVLRWLIAIAIVAWFSSGSTQVCSATSAIVTPRLVDLVFMLPVVNWVFFARFLVGNGTDFVEFVNQMCFAPVLCLCFVAALGVSKRWIRRRSVLGVLFLVALAFCVFSAPICHWQHSSMSAPWVQRVDELFDHGKQVRIARKGAIATYGALVLLSEMPFFGNVLMKALGVLSAIP